MPLKPARGNTKGRGSEVNKTDRDLYLIIFEGQKLKLKGKEEELKWWEREIEWGSNKRVFVLLGTLGFGFYCLKL